MLTSAQIAAIAAKALSDKKAKDVKVLRTEEQTVLADYFVICNGTSSTHIKALFFLEVGFTWVCFCSVLPWAPWMMMLCV